MTRRDLLSLALPALALAKEDPPDFTLRIAETNVELSPGHIVRTLTYNGQAPGPLLRMSEGRQVSICVINDSPDPEMVHWHGFHIAPEVDGAHEEGTPMVQGHARRTYTFAPRPAGSRWYHAHAMAGHNLKKGAYTGQFGVAIVEPRSQPARYDQEETLVLHEWNPAFAAPLDAAMDMDIEYGLFSINGKMLGAGEPIRVKHATRVLFRVLNASATMQHRLALAGHTFVIVALDGNQVPTPRRVPVLELAPGERVDAIVEMDRPGVWVFGETNDRKRESGAGVVIEYAEARGAARWIAPGEFVWKYALFAPPPEAVAKPDHVIPVVIETGTDGNLWAINGKSYPATDPLIARAGARNRLVFDNRSGMPHPVHLHRHSFEITKYAGEPTGGVFKDVVTVPARSVVEVDFVASNPGPSLLHCHHQFHMDFGFMALLRYG